MDSNSPVTFRANSRYIGMTNVFMKHIAFLLLILSTSFLYAQTIKKENLTKRQFFYYDAAKLKVESEGCYYKDPLGETTLRHGKWKFYDREGDLAEERNYFKNELHGPVISYFSHGKKQSEGYFLKGVQDSVYREWDETGVLRQQGFYRGGFPTGKWEYYYLDGRPKMQEEIIDGISYTWSFWLPDSLHTQTIIDGNGELAIHYSNGRLKEWYSYKDGLKHGPFEEASVYGYFLLKGSFKENKHDGEWRYFYYTGHLEKTSYYKDGVLDGPYFYYYDNEQVNVEGQYKNGKKTGVWTWYTKFGTVDMQGEFVDDLQHGDWIYNYPTGELSYRAQYKQGMRHGKWDYFYKDGKPFKTGEFRNDKKHGNWKTWYENGKLLLDGDYADDKETGVWKNYWENGKLKNESTFKEGELHGKWFSYYPSGILKLSGEYEKNLKTGEWHDHFENGKLKDVENYKVIKKKSKINYGPMKDREQRVSVKHGEFISYSQKDYQKMLEGKYKNDEKEGEWIAYHPGGKYPAVVTTYKDGKLDGPMRSFTFKGNKLISEVNYKEGYMHGKMLVYDKKGRLVKEEEYKNGIRVIEGTKSGTSFTPPR
jgi:uncharacterized protein